MKHQPFQEEKTFYLSETPLVFVPAQKNALVKQAIYRLFAWLFLYIDSHQLNILQSGAAELHWTNSIWSKRLLPFSLYSLLEQLTSLSEDARAELIQEHNRLFLVKPLTPPYESVVMGANAQARGWIIAQLDRVYARYGLSLSSLNEMPDHLAVELEFMSYLCELEENAWESDDCQAVLNYQNAQIDFLGNHLIRWVPPLAHRVQAISPDGIYTQVLDALVVFVRTRSRVEL